MDEKTHPRWPEPALDQDRPTTPDSDDVETGPLPWETGELTDPHPRTSTGMTPTAGIPRPVPPPPPPSSPAQTRVIPPAWTHPLPPPERTGFVPAAPPKTSARSGPPSAGRRSERGACLLQSFFVAALVVVVLFFVAFAAVVTAYAVIAARLPPPEELISRQTEFVSSRIYDRDGNLLYEVMDPHGGRRTYVTLDRISPHLIQATIATEDADFYHHPGFNPIALVRSFYYALTEGEFVSGGSTITQQLARNLLLSPEERMERTAWRKIKEIVLAYEITRRYPRDTILEIYLNENNYGNLAYGVEAAAQTYFGVSAADLTLSQASFLAGLPQSPAMYDVFAGGRERALMRQQDVLRLMVEQGYISQAQAAAAAVEMAAYQFTPPVASDVIPAPHFVVFVRQVIEATYGPEALYRGDGYRVYTTLDPDLQRLAEQEVAERVAALADQSVTNGALVALDPATGQILAMVGSADFYNEEIDGQVNIALSERQPGSSIKPFTYLAAFERGWTPATLIWDLETQFPDGANPPYVPRNYDDRFHGPVLVRSALANSYNVPAVKTLQFVGVPALKEMARRLGITTLTRDDYGLSLTLGGGEVRLLEMTAAYAVLANNGVRLLYSEQEGSPLNVSYTPILRIEDPQGNVLVDNSAPVARRQVVRPEHAYLITHILSDNQARCPAFGCPNVLQLSRPAAVKTGTTNDYRDSWTIGYTPDLVVGVWVGNADNSPMNRVAGSIGAGYIWHDFMEAALANTPVRNFVRPDGIVEREICSDSGAVPNEYCPPERRRMELFAADQPPLGPEHNWIQMVRIDAFSGLLANEYCPNNVEERLMVVITDPQGRAWALQQDWGGLQLAPTEACSGGTVQPEVRITSPANGAVVYGLVPIIGTVSLPDFDHYEVQYGVGDNPIGWGWISGPHLAQVREGQLTLWDTTGLAPGPYTLRVTAWDRHGHSMEGRAQCFVGLPTETPTVTPTPTAEVSPTPTETPTATPEAPTPTPEAPTPTPEAPTPTPEAPTPTPEAPTPTPEAPTPTPEPPTPTPEPPTVEPSPTP